MITIKVPEYGNLRLKHLVADFNGTIAHDGVLIKSVGKIFTELAKKIEIHVITADTFGSAASQLENLPCKVCLLPKKSQTQGKLDYIKKLGADSTVAVGNGRNDILMLEGAAVGIAVIQREGSASKAIAASDIACTDIESALGLLLNPLRMKATLRG